jgi:translation initiation factor IF-2
MTQNDGDDKPKKLTLGGKLSLNKPIDRTSKSNSFISSTSNTIVEVKKSKLTLGLSLGTAASRSSETKGLGDDLEVSKRLSILKKATEDPRFQQDDSKFSSVSKISAMNQLNIAQKVVEEEIKPEPAAIEITKPKKDVEQVAEDSDEDVEGKSAKKKIPDTKHVPSKPKPDDHKKLNKVSILHMLDGDEGTARGKSRSFASLQRAREKARRKAEQKQEKVYREVIIPASITVGELANRMSERSTDVVRELMKLGIMANVNDDIDADTAEIIATTLGHKIKRILESDVENVLIAQPDDVGDLSSRSPVVTVMGHVDHGKTSLLDALKSSDVVAREAGGITQHIGAYKVTLEDGATITFIDTPGHEAFTSMRSRGAEITDIVILVVAADDGIKPQTIEAINHAKAAKVPIIVAINKIDKPDINIEKVKNELLSHGLISEELGGDTMMIPISATKKTNLDKLLDAILLTAEMLELKANYNAQGQGVVIESKIDKAQGAIATVLVKRGTLKVGDLVVAGRSFGRIKRMKNDKAEDVVGAGPGDPVEIYGLDLAPSAGDKFDVTQTDKQARDITDYRKRVIKDKKHSAVKIVSLEDLFNKASGTGNIKELPLIVKGDVQGSIEAIESSLLKIPSNEVKIKIIHSGVGGITESDLALANAAGAIIIGFNVRMNSSASASNEKDGVDIRYYSIIYNLIDDIRAVVTGMLSPIIREQYIGSAEIRQVFNITKSGKIAGSYVTKGAIKRGAGVRLLRDDIVIYEGKLKTLKRFKEDVKEVAENFECGIAFERFEDIKAGDKVEVFEMIEEKKKLL